MAVEKAVDYCLLGINADVLCMSRAEWSGWAQALGAIFAIIAGAGFVLLQNYLTRKEASRAAQQERLRRLELISHVIAEASAAFQVAAVHVESGQLDFEGDVIPSIERGISQIDAIPPLDHPYVEVFHRLAVIRQNLVALKRLCPVIELDGFDAAKLPDIVAHIKEHVAVCDSAIDYCHLLTNREHGSPGA